MKPAPMTPTLTVCICSGPPSAAARALALGLLDLAGHGRVIHRAPGPVEVVALDRQRVEGDVRRRLLAEQAVGPELRLGLALVERPLGAEPEDGTALGDVDRDVLAEIAGRDHQVLA